ncbi:unnamed protein product [Caenorhabditis sp. 36 PRJEB53466]|nr:unnamed protein product [Caenorhabditis sp. 36 PRJEB53466]
MHWSQTFEVEDKIAGLEAGTNEQQNNVVGVNKLDDSILETMETDDLSVKENRTRTPNKRRIEARNTQSNKRAKQPEEEGITNEESEGKRSDNEEEGADGDADFYHPTYSKTSLALIPDLLDGLCDDYDLDDLELDPIRNVVEEEMYSDFFKQQLNHLPIDKMLKVQSMNDHNFQDTLNSCRGLTYPDMIPQNVKEFFVSNIAHKRVDNPTSFRKFKEFYYAKELAAVAARTDLVEFYYEEKNKLGGNWRQENVGPELTMKQEILTILSECGISIICDNEHLPSRTIVKAKRRGARKDQKEDDNKVVPTGIRSQENKRTSDAHQPITPKEDEDSGYSSPKSKSEDNDDILMNHSDF